MSDMSTLEVGEILQRAARLQLRPLCVYVARDVPDRAVQLSKVDRCIARACYALAMNGDAPAVYMGAEAKEGICGGGQSWCGLIESTPQAIRYFVSTGKPGVMGGAAEFLKASPELVDQFRTATGTIVVPDRFIVVTGYDVVPEGQDVLSFLVFGNAEQIRNLGGLIHFSTPDLFTSILMPGGPSCASFISYPAGLTANAPRQAAYIGPVDPTGNAWFPPDMLALSMPIHIARRMAQDVDASFLSKRPLVAFPEKRLKPGEKGEHF